MKYLPADWADMKAALYAFAVAALPDYSVVWAHQDAPAPAFPYAELRVIAPPKGVGRAERLYASTGDETYRERTEQDVDFTLAVQLHARLATIDGRSEDEVRETAIDAVGLELAAQQPDALLALERAGIVVRGVIATQDLTGIGGARHESRTALELRLGARARTDLSVDWFADIQPFATITDGENFTGEVSA